MFQSIYLCIFKPRISKVSLKKILVHLLLISCRAFKSILKCHRPQYRTSASFYRISASTIAEQIRLDKSPSCDITATHSLNKSDSITSHRASCDSQGHFLPLNGKRRLLDRPQLSSAFRRLSNRSDSSKSFDHGSPWHLRQPNLVR